MAADDLRSRAQQWLKEGPTGYACLPAYKGRDIIADLLAEIARLEHENDKQSWISTAVNCVNRELEAQVAALTAARDALREKYEAMLHLITVRRISNRFSVDAGEIIKTSNGEPIPHDEPLLILRARDRLALPLLRIYQQLSVVDGCNDWFLGEQRVTIEQFEAFAREHPERMKQPGVTRGK